MWGTNEEAFQVVVLITPRPGGGRGAFVKPSLLFSRISCLINRLSRFRIEVLRILLLSDGSCRRHARGVPVTAGVGVTRGVGVFRGVAVALVVGVARGVRVGEIVGAFVGTVVGGRGGGKGVDVAVGVAVGVGVAVEVGVAVGVGGVGQEITSNPRTVTSVFQVFPRPSEYW